MPTATEKFIPGEFDFAVDERDWGAVQMLLAEIEHDLSERRRALLHRLAVWQVAVSVLRRAETRLMVLREPSRRDLDYHRAILSYLLGVGRLLLLELKKHAKIDPSAIGVSFEDVSAIVDDLAYSERERYGDMKQEFRDRLLEDVFGG